MPFRRYAGGQTDMLITILRSSRRRSNKKTKWSEVISHTLAGRQTQVILIKKHLPTEFYLVSVIRFLCLLSYWFFVFPWLCLGLDFIVYIYYVAVIAFSHHLSVVICFIGNNNNNTKAAVSDNIPFPTPFVALQRGNAVSFHNTKVTV